MRCPKRAQRKLGALLTLLCFSFVAMAEPSEADAAPHTVWHAEGSNGVYGASFQPVAGKLALGEYSVWKLKLVNASGQPLDKASIGISAGMFGEGHGHGMPTSPVASAYLGDGFYQIEGVLFSMLGDWTFFFDVEQDGQRDRIRIDLGFSADYL